MSEIVELVVIPEFPITLVHVLEDPLSVPFLGPGPHQSLQLLLLRFLQFIDLVHWLNAVFVEFSSSHDLLGNLHAVVFLLLLSHQGLPDPVLVHLRLIHVSPIFGALLWRLSQAQL